MQYIDSWSLAIDGNLCCTPFRAFRRAMERTESRLDYAPDSDPRRGRRRVARDGGAARRPLRIPHGDAFQRVSPSAAGAALLPASADALGGIEPLVARQPGNPGWGKGPFDRHADDGRIAGGLRSVRVAARPAGLLGRKGPGGRTAALPPIPGADEGRAGGDRGRHSAYRTEAGRTEAASGIARGGGGGSGGDYLPADAQNAQFRIAAAVLPGEAGPRQLLPRQCAVRNVQAGRAARKSLGVGRLLNCCAECHKPVTERAIGPLRGGFSTGF